jgi:hypothetical protein
MTAVLEDYGPTQRPKGSEIKGLQQKNLTADAKKDKVSK